MAKPKHNQSKPIIERAQVQKHAPTLQQSGFIETYAVWILGAFACLLYANTLGHGFVLDDPLILEQNKYVTRGLSGIPDLFFKSYRAEVADGAATGFLYRPLSPMFFAIEWALGGGKPFLFHLLQVLWYGATVMMVFITFRSLFRPEKWQLAALIALLFAVHPLHTEVVANIKSRDEILALFFCVTALYFWLKWRDNQLTKHLYVALASFFLALLSKESAITFLPVFPLTDWFFRDKSKVEAIKGLALAAVPVVAFLALRGVVHAGFSGATAIEEMDNPIVTAPYSDRLATGFMVLLNYLKLLIWPSPLTSDYSYLHLPIVSWSNAKAILGLLVYGALGVWTILGLLKRQVLAFFSLAFLTAISVYSQLIIVIGTLFGERLMYLPSLWLIAGLIFAAYHFLNTPGQQRIFFGIGAAVSIVCAALTFNRNSDWASNLSLFTADVQTSPNSIRLNNGVGSEAYKAYAAAGRPAQGIEQLAKTMETHANAALDIKPNPISYINLGLVAIERKDYAGAEKQLLKALELAPNLAVAKQNLIVIYLNWSKQEGREKNNIPEAIRLFEKLLALGHRTPEVLHDSGTAYAIAGNQTKAIEYYTEAYKSMPNDANLRKNLAQSYRAIGNLEKAKEFE
jgi:protein O-mannosyl-transferase